MDMVSMMTQSQIVTGPVIQTAAAGTAPLSSGLPVTPVLFAALLQEMLPAVPDAAAPLAIAMKPPVSVKSTLSGKGNANINQEDETGDAGDVSPVELARLLAMTGQLTAGQTRLQNSLPAESAVPETMDAVRKDFPGSRDEDAALSGAEDIASAYVKVVSAGWSGAAPVQMPGGRAEPRTVPGPAVGSALLDTGDGAVAPHQPQPAALQIAVPEIMTDAVEKTFAQSVPVGSGTLMPDPAMSTSGMDANLLSHQSRHAAEVSVAPVSALPSAPATAPVDTVIIDPVKLDSSLRHARKPESGRIDSLLSTQNDQTVQLQAAATSTSGMDVNLLSHKSRHTAEVSVAPINASPSALASVSGSGQPGESAQAPAATGSTERKTGQAQGTHSVSGGKQAQITPAVVVPFTISTPADVSQRDGIQDRPGASLTGTTPPAVEPGTLLGMASAVQEWKEAHALQQTGDGAENRPKVAVEVIFTNPPARSSAFGEKDTGESGAHEKKKENLSGFSVAAARTPDLQGSSRVAFPTKMEEPISALHESILTQVKASVVSHDGKGNGTMTIRLNPVELGDLQVNVRVENQQVRVEIVTDNRMVRDALMGNLDNLKETFQKQNLSMERFDVSSGTGNGFGQGFREERGDQRRISTTPFGHGAVALEFARENSEDDWGMTENSLVNLRL